jgi:D-3-phosphoglycerate dehydrogenase
VYEEEPVVGANHPLLQMENVLCTPHLGYAERESYEGMYATAVDQLLAYADGKPIGVVNPEVLARA